MVEKGWKNIRNNVPVEVIFLPFEQYFSFFKVNITFRSENIVRSTLLLVKNW